MNCSQFLLNAILRNHVSAYYVDESCRTETVLHGINVDDWSAGSPC